MEWILGDLTRYFEQSGSILKLFGGFWAFCSSILRGDRQSLEGKLMKLTHFSFNFLRKVMILGVFSTQNGFLAVKFEVSLPNSVQQRG